MLLLDMYRLTLCLQCWQYTDVIYNLLPQGIIIMTYHVLYSLWMICVQRSWLVYIYIYVCGTYIYIWLFFNTYIINDIIWSPFVLFKITIYYIYLPCIYKNYVSLPVASVLLLYISLSAMRLTHARALCVAPRPMPCTVRTTTTYQYYTTYRTSTSYYQYKQHSTYAAYYLTFIQVQ